MLEFTLPLVFTPDDALFFIPSEDNFEEEVRKSLENFADVDFFENIVNDATKKHLLRGLVKRMLTIY